MVARESLPLTGGLGATLGLLVLGLGLGRGLGMGVLWVGVLGWVACALPAGFWLVDGPAWSPEWTARWLLLDPAALALEAAGVDFLRLPSVYDALGGDALGPGLWIAWGGLAGWGALVVGWVLALLGRLRP